MEFRNNLIVNGLISMIVSIVRTRIIDAIALPTMVVLREVQALKVLRTEVMLSPDKNLDYRVRYRQLNASEHYVSSRVLVALIC
jgi:hypothetical protein